MNFNNSSGNACFSFCVLFAQIANMKRHPFILIVGILSISLSTILLACKKNAATPTPRTIRYILYTKEDFSNVDDTIRFRLHIHTTGITGRVLFDSNIAPMKVSEIPDPAHEFVFTKTVPPGYDKEKLVIGFVYDIDKVGESWYLDSMLPSETKKTVEYSFK